MQNYYFKYLQVLHKENKCFLKGTVQQEFHPSFFQYSYLPGPLTNGLKYFRFWLRFRGVIKILGLKEQTRQGMIPRGD